MKFLLTIALWGVLCSSSTTDSPHIGNSNSSVYICTGKTAYSYHNNRSCRGLNRCSAEIQKVSLEYAKSIGRSPCKICY
jgi:hypothetical protein